MDLDGSLAQCMTAKKNNGFDDRWWEVFPGRVVYIRVGFRF